MTPGLLDLHLPGEAGGHTAAFLVTGAEPALVDCGATATLASLEEGLAAAGVTVEDLRHLLLTHIHLDHAGAAGALAARCPGLEIWVHAAGAPHLIDPSRLMASAARVFGERLEELFGVMTPVPAERLHLVEDATAVPGSAGVEAFPTPGHARHHLAFAASDGTIYAGDVAGSSYLGARYLMPEAPPPDIDIHAWQTSLDAIGARRPSRLAVSHCDIVERPLDLIEDLHERLPRWAAWAAVGRDAFLARTRAEAAAAVPADILSRYVESGTRQHSYDGLARWIEVAADAPPA